MGKNIYNILSDAFVTAGLDEGEYATNLEYVGSSVLRVHVQTKSSPSQFGIFDIHYEHDGFIRDVFVVVNNVFRTHAVYSLFTNHIYNQEFIRLDYVPAVTQENQDSQESQEHQEQ